MDRTQPTKFTMKVPPKVRVLALQALAAEAPGCDEAKRLQEVLSKAINRMQVTADEAGLLASMLVDYAEGHLREGSNGRRMANEFAHALGDIAVTADEMTKVSARELQDAVDEVARADQAIARADEAFNERMRQKRDEGLREVFIGGPDFKRNIWTGEFEPVDAPEDRYDLRGMEKETLRTPVYLDPEVKVVPSRTRVRHLGGVVGTAPVALSQKQADDATDALGVVTDHNTRMKIEGARQLILDRNRGAGE